MDISVFGLGYVGSVSAACLAVDGHRVIGVDVNQSKVDFINQGQAPVVEKGLDAALTEGVAAGRLSATIDGPQAVLESELSLVCVGTPSLDNGDLDLQFLVRVCEEIGAALRDKSSYHVVVIRSTVTPGTIRRDIIPALESASGKRAGDHFGVCGNPEFLREGSAIDDFRNPPKTVIGQADARSGDLVASLYRDLDAPLFQTDIEVAEMVKYVDNVWHALKVGFANEMGNIAKASGIDSHRVLDIFCQDTKLNLSARYLKPGFAFGGSCLPKDVRALAYRARSSDIDAPILSSILPSNQLQIDRGLKMVTATGHKRIGVLGFSFKAGTDDLRESPMVSITEALIGKGYDLRLYDSSVNLARLQGANRNFIMDHIPHLSALMVDNLDDVLEHAETVVIGNADPDFGSVVDRLRPDQRLVDLVRIADPPPSDKRYDGICW